MSDLPTADGRTGVEERGPLRPIELATGAVLGGVTVGLVTVGSVVPLAAALQIVAAVPMGMLAHRYRPRALVTATASATLVTFVAAGVMPALGVVGSATIGGIIGGVKRRGGGLISVFVLSVLAGALWGAFSVGSLLVAERTRELLFDTIRNTANGVQRIAARQPALEPLGRAAADLTDAVLAWWWVYVGGGVLLGVVVSALFSWFVLGSVLDRLAWLPTRDRLDAPVDDRPIAPLPVTLHAAGFRYPGAHTDALRDIDLSVRVGEFVAIVGHNGSGKSTLTRLLAGLPPTSGTVERPGSAGLGHLGGTALVLQRPESQTLGVLVADDVVWGLPPDLAAEVDTEALLGEVGLAGMGDRETATLSGGQQQRLAVAAALARRPALLIADEATSMIDPDGRRELVALLGELPRRHPMAVVLVTHHEADAAAAHRVVHLAGGRTVERLPFWPQPVRDTRRRPVGQTVLELRDVRHTYNRGTPWEAPALHGVDLVVRRGEALLVVGGNGSGKSTLAWIIAGLIHPTSGRCDLGGRPVTRQIGRVELAFQHSRLQLQKQTVGAEISDWGGRATGSGAVGRALDAVGLDRALAARSIEELSGGQAKRVVLAAIVASHPQVVVLDEPLAGLDPEGRADIVELLARLRDSGLTLIVISHDVADMAAVCDRTVHLSSGRILETQPVTDAAPAAHRIDPHRDPRSAAPPRPGDAAWRFGHGGAE
ncbi:ATP-binding cassette domain-containing protein [Nocardia amikacinitolerans]|uniref:ATP-binding cassette domain-containing protein n=1 Tax=Nocardia amikacinitolerans TaxID=756689 RepID=UPI0020A36987|nr:ABC transporter ATP-binding protein [Nocardia amikacinitolerans]MCP2293388.1 energy-coupling factor transport system ATP-binding protein [Nocardia amikacinitolerans]